MLQTMQQSAPSQPPPPLSSFAGLLASLASPQPPSDAADDALQWDSGDLGEDVATLSYERALHTHARYRPANRDLERDSDRGEGSPTSAREPASGARPDASMELGAADAARGLQTGTARESDLRSASVTIRLSRTECARMHQRAAEAGLTVSAYLRSCAVEAEGLRAQVKQALAEMKASNEGTSHSSGEKTRAGAPCREHGNRRPARRSFFAWIRWLTGRGR
jgi:hypothetical protein